MEKIKINDNNRLYRLVRSLTSFNPIYNYKHRNLCTYSKYILITILNLLCLVIIGCFFCLLIGTFTINTGILGETLTFDEYINSTSFLVLLFGIVLGFFTLLVLFSILFLFFYIVSKLYNKIKTTKNKIHLPFLKSNKTSLINRMWEDFKEKKCSKIEIISEDSHV